MTKKELLKRLAVMLIGIYLMTFAIAMTVISGFGTTPLSTLPSVLFLRFPNLSFGTITFIWNGFLVLVQLIVLRKNFSFKHIMQIPLMFVFSAFIDLNGYLLRFTETDVLISNIALLAVSLPILALSISLTVSANAVMNSGEGVVKAFSDAFKLNFGYTKIALDCTYVVAGVILSLVFFGRLRGVGFGTAVLAVSAGFIVNIFSKLIDKPLESFYKR